MAFCYEYARPAVGVDVVVFQPPEQRRLLLIQRQHEPYKDHWALPGGFMEIDETLEQAAQRELKEETGLDALRLRQIGAFSAVDRDPRTRVLSVAFLAVVDEGVDPVAGDDAKSAAWIAMDALPRLAFDHAEILARALEMA